MAAILTSPKLPHDMFADLPTKKNSKHFNDDISLFTIVDMKTILNRLNLDRVEIKSLSDDFIECIYTGEGGWCMHNHRC